MTTKRIMEIEEAGVGLPDYYHGGQGFCSRSTKEARAERAKAMAKIVREDMSPDGGTFEEHEAMARLRGRIV